MSKEVEAYFFSKEDRKLRYGDNRHIKVGSCHKVKGGVKLCRNGLHASVNILSALEYAPGPILYKVTLKGAMDIDTDKIAAQERHYNLSINLDSILWKFARKCALSVVHLWDAPQVVKDYLETGDESLRDASWAASSAASWAASRYAPWAASSAASRDASWDASLAASRHASLAASRHASWAASRYASRAEQNKWLEEMINEELSKRN